VTEPLLRAREVAELLGVAPATVLDWFEAGKLPGFRLSSRAVRFRESEVLGAWLEARRGGGTGSAAVVSSCDPPTRGIG
jgi:excisionase family DNA binding protein